jgi:Flp pilus assembly protein TadG
MRFKEEDGNVLALTAFGLTFLIGFLALAVDTGRILFTQRQLQTFADAAALAGSYEIGTCGTTANCTTMQNAAKAALTENGATSATVVTQCGTSAATGIILQVNNGPCYMGTTDPNHGSTSYVEAVVTLPVSTLFATVLGQNSIKVQARAEAGGSTPKYCGYILSPTASNALLENGSATLNASCGLIVDSSSSSAAIFNGGDNITTTVLNIVGGDINNGSNIINPSPTTNATAVPDPLSTLATPTIGSCGTSTSSPFTGATNQALVNSGSGTFHPGVYCGGITINSGSATFTAGTYIIKGAMIVNGGDTVTGSGVTFYFTSGGSLTMNGSSHAVFSAPTSGTYEGILYFQDRTDSNTLIINGDTTSSWQGVIYAPDANLTLNGGSNVAAYTDVVVNTLTQNGSVNFKMGSDYSSLADGAPIKSNTTAYLVE